GQAAGRHRATVVLEFLQGPLERDPPAGLAQLKRVIRAAFDLTLRRDLLGVSRRGGLSGLASLASLAGLASRVVRRTGIGPVASVGRVTGAASARHGQASCPCFSGWLS